MGVSLSRSAWHFRLQKYAYGKDPEVHDLCPYFWSTVMALVFLLPTIFGSYASPYLDEPTESSCNNYYDGTRLRSNLDLGIQSSFMVIASLLAVAAIIFILFMLFTVVMAPGGAVALLTGIAVVALVVGTIKSAPLWGNYLLALKDRVCPMITWTE